MLITKTVKLKWNKRNKDYYINKGYNFTFLGDKFEINANDLTKGSHKEVVVKCDYCGNITKKDISNLQNPTPFFIWRCL